MNAYAYLSIPKYFCTTIAVYCAQAMHVIDRQHFLMIGALSTGTYTNINQICTSFVFDIFFQISMLVGGVGWGGMRLVVGEMQGEGDAPKLDA